MSLDQIPFVAQEDKRNTEFLELQCQVQTPLEIGGIHNINHQSAGWLSSMAPVTHSSPEWAARL
jgi:hypothetical protein